MLSSILLAWVIRTIPKEGEPHFRHSNCFSFLLKYIHIPIKVVVEQGDPFLSSVTKTGNLRYAVGSFLLVGIVISNAYKSENVYNIMTLRQPIPYEKFDELVENNFTIYTRLAYIRFDDFTLRYMMRQRFQIENGQYLKPNLTKVNPHYFTFDTKYTTMLGVSSEAYEWTKASRYNDTTSEILEKIMNHTILHRDMESLVTTSFHQLLKKEKSPYWVRAQTENRVWNLERTYLLNFLFECNRAAVVAPQILANEFGQELQRNNTKNVYVGKESYSDISLSLTIRGWVQPIVFKRIKYIKQSGVWDWMPKFFQNSKQFNLGENSKSLEEQTPNMSGNIVMLFLMLFYGLALSCFLILFELRVVIFQIFLICWYAIVHLFKYIWKNMLLVTEKLRQERKPHIYRRGQ